MLEDSFRELLENDPVVNASLILRTEGVDKVRTDNKASYYDFLDRIDGMLNDPTKIIKAFKILFAILIAYNDEFSPNAEELKRIAAEYIINSALAINKGSRESREQSRNIILNMLDQLEEHMIIIKDPNNPDASIKDRIKAYNIA